MLVLTLKFSRGDSDVMCCAHFQRHSQWTTPINPQFWQRRDRRDHAPEGLLPQNERED